MTIHLLRYQNFISSIWTHECKWQLEYGATGLQTWIHTIYRHGMCKIAWVIMKQHLRYLSVGWHMSVIKHFAVEHWWLITEPYPLIAIYLRLVIWYMFLLRTTHGVTVSWTYRYFNKLTPSQNGRHFPDDIFKCMSENENVWISITISLTFVPKGPIKYITLSEPMAASLLWHVCVIRFQWVNKSVFLVHSGRQSHFHRILRNIEVATNSCRVVREFWNLTSLLAALLSTFRRMYFRAIQSLKRDLKISRFREIYRVNKSTVLPVVNPLPQTPHGQPVTGPETPWGNIAFANVDKILRSFITIISIRYSHKTVPGLQHNWEVYYCRQIISYMITHSVWNWLKDIYSASHGRRWISTTEGFRKRPKWIWGQWPYKHYLYKHSFYCCTVSPIDYTSRSESNQRSSGGNIYTLSNQQFFYIFIYSSNCV